MVVAALAVSIAALLLCCLLALAVLELVADRPTVPSEPSEDTFAELELAPGTEGTPASSHGLSAAIDLTPAHLVLVVSPMCAVCQRLALSFEGSVPEHLTVVVTASDPTRMRKWVAIVGLGADDVVLDEDMAIANSLGVTSSPTVVGLVAGRVAFAANLGGRPALDSLLAQRLSILADAPGLAARASVEPEQSSADAARVAEPVFDD